MNIRKVSLEMSIDIRITQKGLLKKTLPLHVITGSDLCYGTSDGMKLKENDLSSDEIIMYHSNHISRGFSIEWTPEKKDYVDLRALSPDSREGLIFSLQYKELHLIGNVKSRWTAISPRFRSLFR